MAKRICVSLLVLAGLGYGLYFFLIRDERADRFKAALQRLAAVERSARKGGDEGRTPNWSKVYDEREAARRELAALLSEYKANPQSQAAGARVAAAAVDQALKEEPNSLEIAVILFREVRSTFPPDALKPQRQALSGAWRQALRARLDAVDCAAVAQPVAEQIIRYRTENNWSLRRTSLDEAERFLTEGSALFQEEWADERARLKSLRETCWLQVIRSISASGKPELALRLVDHLAEAEKVRLPAAERASLLEAWFAANVRSLSPALASVDGAAAEVVWQHLLRSDQRRDERYYAVAFPGGVLYAENGKLAVLTIPTKP
jgi:hypothetical protein